MPQISLIIRCPAPLLMKKDVPRKETHIFIRQHLQKTRIKANMAHDKL